MESFASASTGLRGLDRIIDGLRLGDNVVWQVDSLDEYRTMIQPFVAQAQREDRRIIYIRFGDHEPLVDPSDGVVVHRVDPTEGFESFATTVHQLLADEGRHAYYVVDCLTGLLNVWHSDLMVMNFFKVTCPFLYELDTVAYFALIRNKHTFATIAGIRETTQLLLDLYNIDDQIYVHPLKVWMRHSPTMFFPHQIQGDDAFSVTSSGASARLFASLNRKSDPPDHWQVLLDRGWAALEQGPQAQAEAKQLLTSVLIGRGGRMVELSLKHLSLADVLLVASREIGTGYIGGKSVGMLVARAVLDHDPRGRFADRLEAHDSYFVGSDLFYTFIVANGWWKLWTEHKTPEGYLSAGARLHELMRQGRFPPSIREPFLQMLEYFGQSPIIVRSSSLLEDNFGNAFAGKYESVFCVNQGTPEERYLAFEDAVRTIYASAVSEEALAYRLNRNLMHRDEQMALLVQRVSGDHHGEAFYPHVAGVGNSSNLYVWDPGIDMEAGMVRLVVGLGTRAVDRTFGDYAKIVTLDDPTRELKAGEGGRYDQRQVDVLSLSNNLFSTVALNELTTTDIGVDWGLFASPDQIALQRLRERGRPVTDVPRVLDFHRLLTETDFAALLREMLGAISAAYDYPVDIEFTANFAADNGFRVNLVQCRPLQTRGLGRAVEMPTLTGPEECLFATRGNFMGGNVRLPIDYVIMVRPKAYLGLGQRERYAVARRIGVLNNALRDRGTMIMAPGRFGTSTPSLGLPVHFTEICHASVLCELTYAAGGFQPELSYGSHFFQDLVESGIFYAAIFDGEADTVFNPKQVLQRENLLADIDPEALAMSEVIHVARFCDLELYSDVVSQRLVCK